MSERDINQTKIVDSTDPRPHFIVLFFSVQSPIEHVQRNKLYFVKNQLVLG